MTTILRGNTRRETVWTAPASDYDARRLSTSWAHRGSFAGGAREKHLHSLCSSGGRLSCSGGCSTGPLCSSGSVAGVGERGAELFVGLPVTRCCRCG